jgi:hypothetical protein
MELAKDLYSFPVNLLGIVKKHHNNVIEGLNAQKGWGKWIWWSRHFGPRSPGGFFRCSPIPCNIRPNFHSVTRRSNVRPILDWTHQAR